MHTLTYLLTQHSNKSTTSVNVIHAYSYSVCCVTISNSHMTCCHWQRHHNTQRDTVRLDNNVISQRRAITANFNDLSSWWQPATETVQRCQWPWWGRLAISNIILNLLQQFLTASAGQHDLSCIRLLSRWWLRAQRSVTSMGSLYLT